jgi:hypothetical protein
MKKIVCALLLAAGAMHEASALDRPAPSSPLLGTWAVDVSRLPIPPAARPKHVTITFSEADAGRWTTQVVIVDADGKESRTVGTAALDGSASPVQNSLEADTAALKLPMPGVLVMELVRGAVPASTRVYATAADGKTMVETAVYVDRQGVPVMRTNYFTRVE